MPANFSLACLGRIHAWGMPESVPESVPANFSLALPHPRVMVDRPSLVEMPRRFEGCLHLGTPRSPLACE